MTNILLSLSTTDRQTFQLGNISLRFVEVQYSGSKLIALFRHCKNKFVRYHHTLKRKYKFTRISQINYLIFVE